MEEFDKLKDIHLSLRKFWERASVWTDKNEISNAKEEIKDITKELNKAKAVLRKIKKPKKKSKKYDPGLESATLPFRSPFAGKKRSAYERRVKRLSFNLHLAKSALEGATARKKHAERQLKKLERLT